MKPTRDFQTMRTILIPFLLVIILFFHASPSHALGGRINSPVIVIPKPIPPGSPILIAPPASAQSLVFKDFEEAFLDGYFINQVTWLYFAGNTKTLSGMIDELSRTAGARFRIQFTTKPIPVAIPFRGGKEQAPKSDASWMIQHDNRELTFLIFTGPGGIQLDHLELPVLSGPASEATSPPAIDLLSK